jgi:hypothetical protein
MRLDKEEYKIIRKLCDKYNLTQDQVFEIVKAPFKFIREKTANLEIDLNWTEEEFEKNMPNFNLPSTGKLYSSYGNFKRIKKAKQNAKKRRRSESSEEVQGRKEDR